MSEVANYILSPNNVEAEIEAMGELSDKYITEAINYNRSYQSCYRYWN